MQTYKINYNWEINYDGDIEVKAESPEDAVQQVETMLLDGDLVLRDLQNCESTWSKSGWDVLVKNEAGKFEFLEDFELDD